MMNRLKRRMIGIILSIALGFSLISSHVFGMEDNASTKEIATIVSSVSFRSGPSTSNTRIRYLKKGEVVDVLEHVNQYWLKVQDESNRIGYISASTKYVSLATVAQSAEPNATIIRGVSFRTGPSTSYERMRYLKTGEQVHVLEKVNEYWYKIEDAFGVIGYVSTNEKYIELHGEIAKETTSNQSNGVILKSVSFRTGPSTSYDRMRYLKTGEQVRVLEKVSQYWYKIEDASGVIGYVSTNEKYIQTSYIEPYTLLDKASAAEKVIEAGMKYLGTPYEFGSSRYDTTTFDCSDFVRQAFMDGIGQFLPSDSRSQADYVRAVGNIETDWRNLQAGDLLFFMSYLGYKPSDYEGIDKSEQTVTHVAIYLGDGQIMHTYSEKSGGVRIDSIEDSSWSYRFLFGGSTY